jgi:toxin ParE1/3/4
MRRQVAWSEAATADLEYQFEYLADRSPSAADRLMKRIITAVNSLAQNPIGRFGRVYGTYEFYVQKSSMIVVYTLEGSDRLVIARVIHASRDFKPGEFPPVL